MASLTSLANRALVRLGETRIADPGQGDMRSQLVLDMWPDVRRGLLTRDVWNFAKRRAILSPVAFDGASWGWAYKLRKPGPEEDHSGWVRNVALYRDDRWMCPLDPDYRDEGGYILANQDTVYMLYIADVTDLGRMHAAFIDVAMYALAAELAVALSNSDVKHKDMLALRDEALSTAAGINAIDTVPVERGEGSWGPSRHWGN